MLKSTTKRSCLREKPGTAYSLILLSIILLLFVQILPTEVRADSNLQDAWQEIISQQPPSCDSLKPAVDRFINIQQQSNIKNISIYSLALIQMAADDKLSPVVKETLTTAAIRISPEYSFPETAFCKLMFEQHRYPTSLMSLFRALKKFQSNPLESLYASTFFWLALAFTPLALLFFLSLILSIKYYRAFCDKGNLNLSNQGRLKTILISLTVAFLIIVLPAPLLGLLILSVSLALLATRNDIIALLLLVASLIIVPLAYEKGMASLLALDSSFFKAARSSTSGINSEDNEAYLTQPATNQSQLVLQLFAQAEAARRRREYAKATFFLEKIIDDRVEIGAVYNNLANLYILQGNYEKSEALFVKAAKFEKDSGIPYYNLSVTYIQKNFNLQKSSQALAKAFKLDPSLSKVQTDISNSESELRSGTRLFFMNLPENFYRRYADAQPGKKIYLPEFFQQVLFPGVNLILYFILISVSLAGLIYFLYQTPANRRICSNCGRMFHPVQKLKEKHCPICHMNNSSQTSSLLNGFRVMTNSSKLHPLKIVKAVTWVLIPGSYPMFAGYTMIGSGLMFLTVLWFYNHLICQTTIMAPFPPSTAWINTLLPFIIWSLNFIILIFMLSPKRRHKFSRGNP